MCKEASRKMLEIFIKNYQINLKGKKCQDFLQCLIKICSPAGAVNIPSDCNPLALFCRFPFITGYGKSFPYSKHFFKWNLSDVCSYVTNAGLASSARVTANAIEKTPQSTWFDCTGCILTLKNIVLVSGRIILIFWCKNTRGIFPLFREL